MPTSVPEPPEQPLQTTEREGREPEHTHPATTHCHDRYHVTHEHSGSITGEWHHKTYWHTHPHNHNELTHSHDYSREEEGQQHGKRAHVHDHARPTESGV
jgi:hypothetical protein